MVKFSPSTCGMWPAGWVEVNQIFGVGGPWFVCSLHITSVALWRRLTVIICTFMVKKAESGMHRRCARSDLEAFRRFSQTRPTDLQPLKTIFFSLFWTFSCIIKQGNHRYQTSPALCTPITPSLADRPHPLRSEFSGFLFVLAWYTEWSLLLHDVTGDWMIPFAAMAAAKTANAFEWPR